MSLTKPLHIDVSALNRTDGDFLLIKILYSGPPKPEPEVLTKLFSILERKNIREIIPQNFPPEHSLMIIHLHSILTVGNLVDDSVSGISWGSESGFSIHLTIKVH